LEVIVPVKRSNIIKNLSSDIQHLKSLVDELIIKDHKLKTLCHQKGLKVDGLIDVQNFHHTQHQHHQHHHNQYNSDSKNLYHSINSILSSFEKVTAEQPAPAAQSAPSVPSAPAAPAATTTATLALVSPEFSDSDFDESKQKYSPPIICTAGTSITAITDPLSCYTPPTSTDTPPYDLYSLSDCCCFSHSEISAYFSNFKQNYLPFIPIVDPSTLSSFNNLFTDNKLLFWAIVYIVSGNVDIYNKFIIQEVLTFTTLHKSLNDEMALHYLTPILLLCCFPTKIRSTKYDIDDELDTSIFQWLETCRDTCTRLKYVERYIEDNTTNGYKKNTWCAIFILGTFYGFRLGIKWEQPMDFILEEAMERDTYLGELLNVTILLSKLLDHFVFSNDLTTTVTGTDSTTTTGTTAFNANTTNHLIKSLSNWQFKLEKIKSKQHDLELISSSQLANLNITFDFLELTFLLFEPQDSSILSNSALNSRIFDIISSFHNHLTSSSLSTFSSPIFLKISLEFFTLVLTKLAYSPSFLTVANTSKLSTLYTALFNKLITFVEYNDTKFVFNTLMDFDATVRVDASLTEIFSLKAFKNQLLPGLIKDLKKLNQKFKSIQTNVERDQKTEMAFQDANIDLSSYAKKFTKFRGLVDLVILYSNEILKLPANDPETATTSRSTSTPAPPQSSSSSSSSSLPSLSTSLSTSPSASISDAQRDETNISSYVMNDLIDKDVKPTSIAPNATTTITPSSLEDVNMFGMDWIN
jgi:hypothetical protein